MASLDDYFGIFEQPKKVGKFNQAYFPKPEDPSPKEPSEFPPGKWTHIKPVKHVLEDRDRIVAKCILHHEHYMEDPVTMDSGYAQPLEEIEQPFIRPRISIGEEWVKLTDRAIGSWVQNPGVIQIENRTNRRTQVVPTPEELEELNRRIVLVGHPDLPKPIFIIRPGRCCQGEVAEGFDIHLRCEYGTAEVKLMITSR